MRLSEIPELGLYAPFSFSLFHLFYFTFFNYRDPSSSNSPISLYFFCLINLYFIKKKKKKSHAKVLSKSTNESHLCTFTNQDEFFYI